ncbi:glucoamylase [Halosimplex carlsbadense 2-9-1]|uniref:Glucoamylase n=1 Tax=Halosimplex carlsbadense 2-9-1 TaxID=797114 RepID=M0CNP4_9EURY|nr:glycoside hydrolase family 15 protein [Halosimplex carlsbadense]ELZ24866.1 glucoamylase [Halosimplex carlsbadense 2-9-1]
MRLTTALDEYKRARGERFPEETRTVAGAFSGHGDRLVHVDPSGSLRDHSAPLSGLHGIDRSKLGIRTQRGTHWFADLETIRQHYYRDTRLVETEYDAGSFTVHQYDLTLGRAHVTHVELRGAVPQNAQLVAFLTMAPEGEEAGVGALVHEDSGPAGASVLEVFHRTEHDYLTASTGIGGVHGQRPERFAEIVDDHPVDFPRGEGERARDQTRMTGDFVVTAPLERQGRSNRTTLVTQLSDHREIDRGGALADLRACAEGHASADELRAAARDRTTVDVPESTPRSDLVRSDLRVADLLEGPTGARIAAPEFDPFHTNSGGYGYVWFRDDAEIARHVLAAGDHLDLPIGGLVERAAGFHCDAQLPDGTWPHRVWAVDGSLAPGWANGNVERDGDAVEYQADQTASATAFLATVLRERRAALDDDLTVSIRETVAEALDALTRTVGDDGLPDPCQNVWEDATGRFTHTAATYVQAFAAVARAPVGRQLADRALTAAEAVLDGLDEVYDAERGAYPMRLVDGEPDGRLDAATLSLAEAVAAYDAVPETTLDDERLDRVADHVATTLDGLFRNPPESELAGLVRYEGDDWRTADQDREKVWSATTGMGAVAAAEVGVLLNERGRQGDAYLDRAGDLYELLGEDGPLTTDAGYLAEQAFDDGGLDCAAPLGWSHALRLRTTALLDAEEALPARTSDIEGPTDRMRWTTGEKYGLGTAADHDAADPSRVWFTLTEGAMTEVRFPQVDLMNLRTLDFLVNDRSDDEYTIRTHNESRVSDDTVERRVEPTADDALLFRHVFTEAGDGRGHRWELTVEYATDPRHDAIVADVQFSADDDSDYEVFVVADTALVNSAAADRGLRLGESGAHHLVARDPTAYTGETEEPFLVDEDGEGYSVAMAMAARDRFEWATVGAAGSEDLRALFADGVLPEPLDAVDNQSVVLVGRLGTGDAVESELALGFARAADTAAALGEADGALDRGFETVRAEYADTWSDFLVDRSLPDAVADDRDLAAQYRTALMSLYAVEDKTYAGASIASPSVPWGEAVSADEPKGYGYNFVWSRDLYQVFTVFETVGELDVAAEQLAYIYEYQQDDDGFIPQNTYVNGITRWGGEQMDNISYPAVMAYHLAEHGLGFDEVDYDYEHVRRSADYVARNGPESAQERWEEESGYSPSSIAAEIAGLACAGKLAVDTGREADALVWTALADQWVNNVEDWTATETGTERHENTPYYVRVTRDGDPEAGHLRTLANAGPTLDERDIIDGGFLDLVRLGIVPGDDEVVRNSVAEVDDTIRVDAGSAAGFYRYNGDGYGERERGDVGGPWSVEHKGKGRLWPLLTGERGEYELHLDDPDLAPEDCLRAMQEFANSGRMIAEQVWDREHATDYDWEFGEGTGSATPLAWSMAQYVRLAHGVSAGEPVETPAFVRERYRDERLHEPDRSPALRVDTEFRGDRLVVSGETTGERVAVKTPVDSAVVEPEGTEFETTVGIERGENQVIVAAGAADVEASGTTVRRLQL